MSMNLQQPIQVDLEHSSVEVVFEIARLDYNVGQGDCSYLDIDATRGCCFVKAD